jgi:uncharacterized protein YhbP (UPF0306 family)
MELHEHIKQYLKNAKLMQLSTSMDGQPWTCSVWFAADNDLNIYWFSSTSRRHSEEVAKNGKVSGAMALPHTPEDEPRGLQFEGDAELLTDEADVEKARSVYEGRIFSADQIDEFIADDERPHRFYRIRPRRFVLFDVKNFPDNSRQEYRI